MSNHRRAVTVAHVFVVCSLGFATAVAPDSHAVADPLPPMHWSAAQTLATGGRTEVRAAETPDGRAVLTFAVSTHTREGRRWSVRFRVQRQRGWGPAHTIATVLSAHSPTFSTAANDRRLVSVVRLPASDGWSAAQLHLREQTLAGRKILSRRLGKGTSPAVAVDTAGDVAVLRHRHIRGRHRNELRGWTIGPRDEVTAGNTVAHGSDTGDYAEDFYSPELVAVAKNLFAFSYIEDGYDGGPQYVEKTAESGIVSRHHWSSEGGVFGNGEPDTRVALTAFRGMLLMAVADHPGRKNGLAYVFTSTYEPYSWTPQKRVSAYTSPDPRLNTNVVFARNGLAAAVTRRVYLSDRASGGWSRGPAVPAHKNRCGYAPSSAFGRDGLNWFVARPIAHNRCAIDDYLLKSGS